MSTNTTATGRRRPRPLVVALALALGLGATLSACKKEAPVADGAAPAETPAAPEAAPATPAEAVSAEVAALSAEQLREAASRAYQESRLYAPAGNNAMEYYLALRDKQPGDAGVSSALVDLLPMTVIATEQSRDRGDFDEARRLLALIEKTDGTYPAVPRLKTTIASAETDAARRAEQEQLTAEQEARRRQELERERAEQQLLAQEQAARELAQQQAAAETARQEAARQEAARQQAAASAPPAARATASSLRAISTPAPRYPPEALRSGTAGEVQVEFTVEVDGSVSSARVVSANPPRTFDRDAVAAVKRWRFEPVGSPVTTRRTINFSPGQ